MFFSLIIIVIGLVFLLKNLGFIGGDVWPIIWPSLLILLGLSLLLKRRRREKRWEKIGESMKKCGEEMRKTFDREDK
jgi:hypothetical protein